MRALRDTALACAADAICVLALHTPDADGRCSCRRPDCSSAGKHPRTLHGLKDATTDPATIAQWWSWWPEANLGVRTGTPGGIIVLDLDSHEAELRLAELFGDLGGLIVQTGRGLHRYYRLPDGVEIASSAGRLGPEIDVRAAGAYVVAPPSLHPSGRRYLFVGGTLEEPPARLLDELRRPAGATAPTDVGGVQLATPGALTTRYGRGVIDRRSRAVRDAPVGERNYALLRAATTCAGYAATGEINLDDAHAALTAAAHDVGLDQRETARTIASGFKRGLASPLRRPPSHRERLLAARSEIELEPIVEESL